MAPPLEEPSLTVLSGSMGGTVFVVDDSTDNVLIGSDPSCRFALPDTAVDPIHARLWIDLEGITVYDTNSPRGVYINDDRVQGQARLRNGDILWLGPPGDDQSVMLQCRLPGTTDPRLAAPAPAAAPPAEAPSVEAPPAEAPPAEAPPPEIKPAAALMAIDLDPSVPLVPETVVEPDTFSLDEPPPVPVGLLAPDAIQPEPTVIQAPEDAFIEPEVDPEPEPTIAMLPDDVDLSREPEAELEPEATVSISAEERATSFTGWDPTAGGITEAADAPWLAGAPATAPEPVVEAEVEPEVEPDPTETIAPVAAAPRLEPEPPPPPPPPPVPAPRPAAPPVARAAATGAAAAGAPAAKAAPPAAPAPRAARAPERPPAPKPRREPAAEAPAPKRREAAKPPDDAAPPRKGAPMGLLIGGGLAAAVAVAAVGWWMLTRGPAEPAGGTVAPPSTVAEAAPATLPPAPTAVEPETTQPAPVVAPVEEEVTIVPRAVASPTPVPSRAPALTPPPTQVAAARPPVTAAPVAPPPAAVAAGLVGRAEAARSAGDLDGAAALFDQALHADPSNAAATAGKAAVTSARAAARKAFMPGRTVVVTQSAKADLSGFDTADVSVKKAPDFSGRIEFAVNPPKVKPGDNYSVQIYLVNEGKKAIKVGGVTVTTNLNGSKSGRSVASKVKEVPPTQRALIEEIPGVWPEDVNWWSTEVLVTANKGDSLKNLLTWK